MPSHTTHSPTTTTMYSFFFLLLLLLLPFISSTTHHHNHHVYLSPSTFQTTYQAMTTSFKIYPYTIPSNHTSLFHTSLLSSHFLTSNPSHAHLFYLPINPDITSRPLHRLISSLKSSFPFWNRSLATDHFFLSSCTLSSPAPPSSSSRNLVELRKNALRLPLCFPSPKGFFIPHKDLSLPPPPLTRLPLLLARSPTNYKFLAYLRFAGRKMGRKSAEMMEGLRRDPEFMIESPQQSDDEETYVKKIESSRFCIFVYEREVGGLGEALGRGCVPVVVTERAIQEMPLIGVVRWEEIGVFVGAGVGAAGLKRKLEGVVGGGKYERMRRAGVGVAHHFVWNYPPEAYDAFHMVLYQLWMRRHSVTYAPYVGSEFI